MINEFELIEKFFKPLTNSNKAAQNLSDDVAKIALKKNEELIISKDVFVEDVHFLAKDGGFKIASKLLRTNLSDIASSGAKPLCYLLGFTKNQKTNKKFAQDFARGLQETQKEFGLDLIGGDTVSSDKLFFSITIFATAKKGEILSRSNAQVGDLIFVSGSIGDAFLGLKGGKDKYLQDRHFFPSPRLNLGQKLIERKLSKCAIDVSDGLLSDLRHICKSSKISALIHQNKIPISEPALKFLQKNKNVKLMDLLCGGDDYELIFSSASKNTKKIMQLSKELNINLTCIGEFVESKKAHEVDLQDDMNQSIKIKKFGYEH